MKAYKVEVLVVPHEDETEEQIRAQIEHHWQVMRVEEAEIGEWSDDHPLNKTATALEHFDMIFDWERSAVSYVLDAVYRRILQKGEITAAYMRVLARGTRCETCDGSGLKLWSNTSMGSGGMAGQMATVGPCPGSARSAVESNCPFAATNNEKG